MPTKEKEKARETRDWEPTKAQASSLRAFSINGEHFAKNIDDIKKEHAGKFIAIYDRAVVSSTSTPEELLEEIKSKFAETELPKVYMVYVPKGHEVRLA